MDSSSGPLPFQGLHFNQRESLNQHDTVIGFMWKLHSNRPTPLPRASTPFARPSPRHSNCKQTKPTKDFIKRWMDKNKYQRDYPRRSTPFATAAFYGNGRLERKAKTNPKRTGRSTIGDCLLFCSMLLFANGACQGRPFGPTWSGFLNGAVRPIIAASILIDC